MNHSKYLPCTKLSGPMVGLKISKTVMPKMRHILSLLWVSPLIYRNIPYLITLMKVFVELHTHKNIS